MKFKAQLEELEGRKNYALGMGGPEKLEQRRAAGVLNARERIDLLFDKDSFFESGMLARGIRPETRDKTPADGKIAGYGRIDGREVGIVSNDFTVLGASSSAINSKKMGHIRRVSTNTRMPWILLGESVGSRMPDRMGAPGRAMLGQDQTEHQRRRESPWISALLGACYGSSTWYACLSDVVVMRKGATMAVASSRVAAMAIKQAVDPEELGGWKLHATTTGLVDIVAEDDEDALQLVRRVLGYLPNSIHELPPTAPVPAGSDGQCAQILDLLPEERTAVYDVRKIINAIVDIDSFLELKARFGRSIATGFARIDGRAVGIFANNPMFKGGALDVDAMRKVTSFLVLCDTYNIPLISLVDQPGFLIGVDGERLGAPGRIMNWMNALSQVTVPKIMLIMRKSYGQAYLNMGGGRNSDEVLCWPMADLGFVDPAVGAHILGGEQVSGDPDKAAQVQERIRQDSSAWALAELYETHSVIDPRETRNALKRLLQVHSRKNGGKYSHLLMNWPTSY